MKIVIKSKFDEESGHLADEITYTFSPDMSMVRVDIDNGMPTKPDSKIFYADGRLEILSDHALEITVIEKWPVWPPDLRLLPWFLPHLTDEQKKALKLTFDPSGNLIEAERTLQVYNRKGEHIGKKVDTAQWEEWQGGMPGKFTVTLFQGQSTIEHITDRELSDLDVLPVSFSHEIEQRETQLTMESDIHDIDQEFPSMQLRSGRSGDASTPDTLNNFHSTPPPAVWELQSQTASTIESVGVEPTSKEFQSGIWISFTVGIMAIIISWLIWTIVWKNSLKKRRHYGNANSG